MKRRVEKSTVALKLRKVAPDYDYETENLGVAREKDKYTASTAAGGEVHAAAAKNGQVRVNVSRLLSLLNLWPCPGM